MREAALLASIRFEQHSIDGVYVGNLRLEEALATLREFTEPKSKLAIAIHGYDATHGFSIERSEPMKSAKPDASHYYDQADFHLEAAKNSIDIMLDTNPPQCYDPSIMRDIIDNVIEAKACLGMGHMQEIQCIYEKPEIGREE